MRPGHRTCVVSWAGPADPHTCFTQSCIKVSALLKYRLAPAMRAVRLLRLSQASAGCHALAFAGRDRVLVTQHAGLPAAQRFFSVSGSHTICLTACSMRLFAARAREPVRARTRSCRTLPFAGGGFSDAGSGRPPCLRPCGGPPRLP